MHQAQRARNSLSAQRAECSSRARRRRTDLIARSGGEAGEASGRRPTRTLKGLPAEWSCRSAAARILERLKAATAAGLDLASSGGPAQAGRKASAGPAEVAKSLKAHAAPCSSAARRPRRRRGRHQIHPAMNGRPDRPADQRSSPSARRVPRRAMRVVAAGGSVKSRSRRVTSCTPKLIRQVGGLAACGWSLAGAESPAARQIGAWRCDSTLEFSGCGTYGMPQPGAARAEATAVRTPAALSAHRAAPLFGAREVPPPRRCLPRQPGPSVDQSGQSSCGRQKSGFPGCPAPRQVGFGHALRLNPSRQILCPCVVGRQDRCRR